MEVLGAVASSIAVVQALAAGKHAVSLFREIPDIQKEFDYLMKELDMIKSMAQAVSRMAPTALEQDLITTAARKLNEITAELEALLRICSRESGPDGNKRSKKRKRKWLVEKSDIKKLQQRMGQSKETLHFALNSSRVSNDIRMLLEQPWAINTIDDTGESPLYLATSPNQVRSMEVLISAGADVNQQSYRGWTPLTAAVRAENVEAVKMLLKSKSNVNLCNEADATALHWASDTVNPEVMSLLLAAGASSKQRDAFVIKIANEAAIEVLLVAGSDLEALNNFGDTPFLQSITFNELEVARGLYLSILDLSGINPWQEDSFGDTPFDYLVMISGDPDEWILRACRRPSLAEQIAFVELYQGVRDQALQNDLQSLERVLNALQGQDIAIAREHLLLLAEKEKRWERENLVSWYRAVDKRIQHAEWGLAAEDLEGHLLDLQEELATPVWEIPSKHGYLWEFDDGGSVSEDGFESEDGSENSDDSNQ
ncbi:ankyrin repeat PH and SEC7 domain protein [Fusarium subglutinans]|uniref:Ankyrin repeat PH and SEC7 domain protein n=1 Tax=Gibberella subglutinans TaxID=42677 RepID=A0A8H5UP29_GIBSU|nr:ankyrin repeat PH and SEC7 domain protein [Fusarium subglutinans]KAF5592415.1 ankyrin repeat PH and SEC7 domain protein [Fusarium subglutinans]